MPQCHASGGWTSRQGLIAMLAAVPDHAEVVSEIAHNLGLGSNAGPEAWNALIREATGHGMLGVIAPYLADFDPPASVRQSMEQRIGVGRLWYQHVLGALEQAVLALDAGGVRVCALKGPGLAARLYTDPQARPSKDIDLLVPPEEMDRAARALRDAGYEGDSEISAAYLLRHAHHLHFSRPNKPCLELHFHAYAGFGIVLPASALLARASVHRISENVLVLVPSPEDELLYLALHAAGHSFIRLMWLYDLKLFVRRYPGLDWDTIADRAEAFGVATAVAYTLWLLDTWLNVRIDRVPRRLKRRGIRSRAADWLLAEVSAPQAASTWDNLGGLIFTSLLCDRAGASARLMKQHILRTTKRRLKRLAPAYLPEEWSV